MKRTLGILIIVALAGVFIPVVAATEYNGSDSYRIEDGGYVEQYFTGLQEGDPIEVTVEVTDGGNIDVMLMDTTNFAKFRTAVETGEGSWTPIVSEKNTRLAKINTVAPSDGDYILVVDNSFQPSGGAESGDYVDVDVVFKTGSQTSSGGGGGLCGGVIVAPLIALGLVTSFIIIRIKNKKD